MRLEVSCLDRMGIAKDILSKLELHGINLISIDASNQGVLYLRFAEVPFEKLQILMPEIRKIESVTDVRTVAFLPSEQEHHALQTLLKTIPDSIFFVDTKGRISIINDTASLILNRSNEDIIDEQLNNWVQGFNFQRWLMMDKIKPQTAQVNIDIQQYLAEMLPIYLPDDHGKNILAGAVITLKSPARTNKDFKTQKNTDSVFKNIIATSDSMKTLVEQAQSMSLLDESLLITGEAGTGKELIASSCHKASNRKSHPFVVINCASLTHKTRHQNESDNNVGNEQEAKALFGYKDLTSNEKHQGYFDNAKGGSILFKEITNLSPYSQTLLLHALQNGYYQAVNDNKKMELNARIICSSQKHLDGLVKTGKFEQELFHRLNVLSFHVPSLMERKSDIMPLTDLFLDKYSQELSMPLKRLSAQSRDYLMNYEWSGNVRQLRNLIFRAVSISKGNIELSINQLKQPSTTKGERVIDNEFETTLDNAMKEYEANLLRRLYPKYPSTRLLAKKLGVSHTAIANKLREYKISKPN